jgi:hypothetical protein
LAISEEEDRLSDARLLTPQHVGGGKSSESRRVSISAARYDQKLSGNVLCLDKLAHILQPESHAVARRFLLLLSPPSSSSFLARALARRLLARQHGGTASSRRPARTPRRSDNSRSQGDSPLMSSASLERLGARGALSLIKMVRELQDALRALE